MPTWSIQKKNEMSIIKSDIDDRWQMCDDHEYKMLEN